MSNKKIENKENIEKNAKENNLLNTILGFIILLVILVIIVAVIILLVFLLKNFFSALINAIIELGKLDAVVIVAIITAFVSVLTVIISHHIENKNKKKEYLTQKREEPYTHYVDMVYKLVQSENKQGDYTEDQILEDVSKFSSQITLWGSKKVVKKWVKFRHNSIDKNPQKAKDNVFLMEEIMNEMRKDLGVEKTKKGDLLSFFINDLENK